MLRHQNLQHIWEHIYKLSAAKINDINSIRIHSVN